MRLILDGNYCSNPQAPTHAFFSLFSRSVCFFVSTVSLDPSFISAPLFFPHSFSLFMKWILALVGALDHTTLSFLMGRLNFPAFHPPFTGDIYAPSIFSDCLLSFLFHGCFSSSCLQPPSLYLPLFFLLLPLHILWLWSPLPLLFSPLIFPLIPLPPPLPSASLSS